MAREKKKHGGKKLSPVKASKLIKLFESLGYTKARQSGSHVHLAHPERNNIITVPCHGDGMVQPGVIRSLIRKANLERDEYFSILEKK